MSKRVERTKNRLKEMKIIENDRNDYKSERILTEDYFI